MLIGSVLQIYPFDFKPSAPEAGTFLFYAKTDNTLYIQDSSGVEYAFGSTTAISQLSGEATGVGPGNATVTLSNSAVIGKILTGFVAGPNSPVSSSDTILEAFEKVQAQINAGSSSAVTSLTGDVTGTGPGATATTVVTVGGKTASLIATSVNDTQAATSTNTASTIVKRDASGNFSANVITASLSGNATTATTSTNFSGSLSGDVSGTQSTTSVDFVGSKTSSEVAQSVSDTQAATASNTASTLVKRDASGNFSANTITANITGNISGTASNVTGVVTIAHGGTNSSTSLNNNRIMQSSAGSIVEAAAITPARALISDANGIPTQSVTTATELSYVSGVTSSIQTQINSITGSGITSLTGDVSATGPGASTATVNSVGGSTAANIHSAELLANAATNLNTPSTIVKRDSSGNFSAGTITAALTGAASANVLKAGDTMTGGLNINTSSTTALVVDTNALVVDSTNNKVGINVTSPTQALDVVGNGLFSGTLTASNLSGSNTGDVTVTDTANIDLTLVGQNISADLTDTTVTAGTYGTASSTSQVTVDQKGRLTSASSVSIQITEAQVTNLTTDLLAKADKTTTISAGSGLTGGGDLSVNRTISMPNVGTAGTYGTATKVAQITTDAQGRVSAASEVTISIPSTAITDFAEAAQDAVGSILTDTATVDFTYDDAGNQITADVKDNSIADVKLTDSGATAGTYGSASKTVTVQVNAKGRVTSISEQDAAILSTQVTDFNEAAQDAVGGILQNTSNINLTYDDAGNQISSDLTDTTVTPGTYGSATKTTTITVNQKGRLTSSSEQNIAIPSTQVTDFTEAAQDAVGATLTDTNSIDFTYDDAGNAIKADLKISADAADSGYAKANTTIHTDGLHVEMLTDIPVQIGTANFIGSGTNRVAQFDHVHSHGNQTSGTLHAAATTSVNGFMSSTDKSKLDTISGTAATNAQILISDGTTYNPRTISSDASITNAGALTVNSVGGKTSTQISTSVNDTIAATNLNTASTIVKRDISGNFSAGTITANLTGNVSGSAGSFTGSLVGDVTGTQGATVVSTVGGKTASAVATSVNDTIAATDLNTVSTIVKRDASGNFRVSNLNDASGLSVLDIPNRILKDTSGNIALRYATPDNSSLDQTTLIGALARSVANNTSQFSIKNTSATALASTDFIVGADTATDTNNFADLGINSSVFSDPTWTISGAGDAYLYNNDKGLAVGTATASQPLILFTGGTLAANERMRITDTGITNSIGFTNKVVALTDAATITTNAALGNIFTVTLGGNRTLGAPTNPTDGQKITYRIRQDATGSRTLSFNAVFNFGADLAGLTLSTSANAFDYIGCQYNGVTSKWDVLAISRNY